MSEVWRHQRERTALARMGWLAVPVSGSALLWAGLIWAVTRLLG